MNLAENNAGLKNVTFADEEKILELKKNLNDSTKRLGIALSGGGVRAAAFQLGALWALSQQSDINEKHLVFSTVSGGSIMGYALASSWINDDFRSSVILAGRKLFMYSGKNTRQKAFLSYRSILSLPYTFQLATSKKIASIYKKSFNSVDGFRKASNVDWLINSSDVRSGCVFCMNAKSTSYDVSDFVSASSAVPILFDTVLIKDGHDTYELVDGGVEDNLGISSLIKLGFSKGEVVLIDAAAPPTKKINSDRKLNRLSAISALNDMGMELDRSKFRTSAGEVIAINGKLSDDAKVLSGDFVELFEKDLQDIRTDLDRFSTGEFFSLVAAGYLQALKFVPENEILQGIEKNEDKEKNKDAFWVNKSMELINACSKKTASLEKAKEVISTGKKLFYKKYSNKSFGLPLVGISAAFMGGAAAFISLFLFAVAMSYLMKGIEWYFILGAYTLFGAFIAFAIIKKIKSESKKYSIKISPPGLRLKRIVLMVFLNPVVILFITAYKIYEYFDDMYNISQDVDGIIRETNFFNETWDTLKFLFRADYADHFLSKWLARLAATAYLMFLAYFCFTLLTKLYGFIKSNSWPSLQQVIDYFLNYNNFGFVSIGFVFFSLIYIIDYRIDSKSRSNESM